MRKPWIPFPILQKKKNAACYLHKLLGFPWITNISVAPCVILHHLSAHDTILTVWCYISVIPMFGRLTQEDQEFESSLDFIIISCQKERKRGKRRFCQTFWLVKMSVDIPHVDAYVPNPSWSETGVGIADTLPSPPVTTLHQDPFRTWSARKVSLKKRTRRQAV